eukprot:6544947-Pyramimonas_sp.AAC.1
MWHNASKNWPLKLRPGTHATYVMLQQLSSQAQAWHACDLRNASTKPSSQAQAWHAGGIRYASENCPLKLRTLLGPLLLLRPTWPIAFAGV